MLVPAPGSTIGTWSVGDIVVGPFVVPFVEQGQDEPDLSGYEVSSAVLRQPDGTTTPVSAVIDGDENVVLTLPGVPFEEGGIWRIEVGFTDGTNTSSAEPLPFAVEREDGWLTLAGVRQQWRDAPANDVQLWRLLDVAREQVVAWAPKPVSTPPPLRFTTAQFTQARNIWNALKADPSNLAIGDEGLLIRPFPLDWTVKAIIRPKVAKPVVR